MSAVDKAIADLRTERDRKVTAIEDQIAQALLEAAALREQRDTVLLDYDTRIGDLADAAEREAGDAPSAGDLLGAIKSDGRTVQQIMDDIRGPR